MTERSPERTDFLANIIVTAVEGGISYWATIEDYQWEQDADHNMTMAMTRIRDDDTGQTYHVTLDVVELGLERCKEHSDAQMLKAIVGIEATNDASNIDAEAADVIIQLATLGTIKYG